MAVGPDGGTTVAWTQLVSDDPSAVVQRTPRGGRPLPLTPLELGEDTVAGPAAATGAGATLVVYAEFDGDDRFDVKLATVAADGSLGPPRTLAADQEAWGQEDHLGLGLATDAAGNAVATWADVDPVTVERRLHARRIAADGTPGPSVQLGLGAPVGLDPQIALTADGKARVVWVGQDGTLQVARLSAGGERDGAVQQVSTGGLRISSQSLTASAAGAVVPGRRRTDRCASRGLGPTAPSPARRRRSRMAPPATSASAPAPASSPTTAR